MRSRWFHKAELHGAGASKRSSWLELFCDVVLASALLQLGNALVGNYSLARFAQLAGVFLPMWVGWVGFTFFLNRYNVDDFFLRILVLLKLFAIGGMAVTAPDVFVGAPEVFAWTFAAVQLVIAVLHFRAFRQVPEAADYSRHWGLVFFVGAVIWTVSGFVTPPYTYGLWAVGLALITFAPFQRRSRELNQRYPWDELHLTERFGMLTLIILGASLVNALSLLSLDGGNYHGLVQVGVLMTVIMSVWWIYFDDVAGSRIRSQRLAPLIWLYGHLPFQLGIVATVVSTSVLLGHDISATAPADVRWMVSCSFGLAVLAVALIDSVTERRDAELSDAWRVRVRVISAVVIVLLAPAGAGMTTLTYMCLLAAVAVAQILFDISMAPFESGDVGDVVALSRAVPSVPGAASGNRTESRLALRRTVRLGAPSGLRQDLYFYLMEGSWGRLLSVYTVAFLVLNLVFAALFLLEPGSIDGAGPESFGDAFFFSVQTMSTIGYGAMSPATDYGNAVVTIEAAVGLFATAFMTGIMFAKASRPKASVLFSNVAVVTTLDGHRTLVFRVGNARGNEVVDASMSVVAVCEHVSPEGHGMRRLLDLDMVRRHTPLFMLSWTAMHRIDENSPLADIDWSDATNSELLGLSVTLTGHDGTYNATIYARHAYDAGDIIAGHHFVDVIGEAPDGGVVVDYRKFHDVEADSPEDGE